MKNSIVNLAFAASLAAAQPHGHGHAQFHQKKNIQERDVYTTVVPVTETAYLLGTQTIDASEAQAGIAKSIYIVVGESTPTYTVSSATSSATVKVDAQFYEKTSKTSSTVISTSSAAPTTASVPTTTSTSAATSTTSKASTTTGATGVDAEFPSGEIDCSTFPSAYGASAVDYLGLGGWSGIQQVPDYTDGIDSVISYIVTAITGESCTEGSFCSYNCPAGYLKAQWPTAQGSTGQSVGGLYCNSDGKLELVRSGYKTLCQKGCGGVTIENKMSSGVSVCRTDYPGTESMTLPLWIAGGSSESLTNVASSDYYTWEGSSTTLQYYVNNKGIEADEACVWTSSSYPTSAGNWAPINIGVGKSSDGLTYMSIFPNSPTSTAELDFDVVISGDISGSCALKSGTYTGGSTTGCTVAITDGGSATITFQDSS
jgi:SUN family beta-glucosidase